jgi:hypothetical protein
MKAQNRETLGAFETFIREQIPGFEVAFKNESKLMSFLSFLSSPFNSEFLTSYTTTWGKKVYFPDKVFYEKDPARSLWILAHEYVHLWDSKQSPVKFKLSYAFPQLLVLLPLLAFGILAWPHGWIVALPFVGYVLGCLAAKVSKVLFWVVLGLFVTGTAFLAGFLTGWVTWFLLGAVLCLVPWPAYWRTKLELRGYGLNLAMSRWLSGPQYPSSTYLQNIKQEFTSPSYYFMCWSGSKVDAELSKILGSLDDSNITPVPYLQVKIFLS